MNEKKEKNEDIIGKLDREMVEKGVWCKDAGKDNKQKKKQKGERRKWVGGRISPKEKEREKTRM